MFGLAPKRLIEKNKNAIRYRYLEELISYNSENRYQMSFDTNIQDLDISIDENIPFNSNRYASTNQEFDEIKYLFIKSTFIIKDNLLISNFVVSTVLHPFSVQINEQLKKFNFAKQSDDLSVQSKCEESKERYERACDIIKTAFDVFDEHIKEAEVEKLRAIVEKRWADVGMNEVLFRKLNTVKNQMFNLIKEKDKDD
jgi:hypothetical protein